jgi:hypothetical protein
MSPAWPSSRNEGNFYGKKESYPSPKENQTPWKTQKQSCHFWNSLAQVLGNIWRVGCSYSADDQAFCGLS